MSRNTVTQSVFLTLELETDRNLAMYDWHSILQLAPGETVKARECNEFGETDSDD